MATAMRKRHYVNGGFDEDPAVNGKRRCVETEVPSSSARATTNVAAAPSTVSLAKASGCKPSRTNGATLSKDDTSIPNDSQNENDDNDALPPMIHRRATPQSLSKKPRELPSVTPDEYKKASALKSSTETANEPKDSDDESESSSSSSSSEESSLLSTWSDDESIEEEELPSLSVSHKKYEGIRRLEKKLELRKKRLKRMCIDQPPAYVQYLEANEAAAGEIRIAEYKESHPSEQDDDENNSNTIQDKRLPSAAAVANQTLESSTSSTSHEDMKLSWLGMLHFEALNSLPCSYTVLVIMLGHTTFYSFLEVACRISYEVVCQSWMSKRSFYIIVTALGLVLLRLNGGLFFYASSSKKYNLVKMEMSNRLKLGILDARLCKRIKGSIAFSSFNMFGYYLLCVGINYFYYLKYENFSKNFEAWFEGIWGRATKQVMADLEDKLPAEQEVALGLVETIQDSLLEVEPTSPTCDYASNLVSNRFVRKMYHFWCLDYTNEYKSVELAFHGTFLLLTIFLACRLGQNIMTFCD